MSCPLAANMQVEDGRRVALPDPTEEVPASPPRSGRGAEAEARPLRRPASESIGRVTSSPRDTSSKGCMTKGRMMTDLNELLSQIPMDQVARRLGVDEGTADQATRMALPALLTGMQANARDPAGADSLGEAVSDHDDDLLEGGVDFDQVDTDDGDKIVSNVFGDSRDQVVRTLAGSGGGDSGIIGKLLPMLAPLVMSFLAKQARGGASSGPASGGGLGDLVGGLLGGGGGGQAGGGGLGDLLGGLLGGGKR